MSGAIGEQLASWGKVAMVETTGRSSARLVRTPVGFVEQPDGTLLVASGSEDSDWALNLRAQPLCRVTIGDETHTYVASEPDADERDRAIVELILKYGTPAERLGRGPVFRLVPRDVSSS